MSEGWIEPWPYQWPAEDREKLCPTGDRGDTYEMCGCEGADKDSHCMYCCRPYVEHTAKADA